MSVQETQTYSGSLLMEEARNLYLAANGFSVRDYDASTFTIGILGMRLKFPNTAGRKRAIPLHDLHHVLTDYGTDWVGEAEIGAWELRAGCNSFITYYRMGSAYRSFYISATRLASFPRS
jgi:hypothetical protein